MAFYTVLFICAGLFQYFCLGKYFLTQEIMGSAMTFLSILFGFYITSLAIFVTSKYVASLYKITDENNKTQTLLHTLLKKYKFGLSAAVLFIAYLFFLLLVSSLPAFGKEGLRLSQWFVVFFLPLLTLNLIYSYHMLSDLLKIILQEAKDSR